MNIAIKIPNADRDERIGSVFNHLFSVILQNEIYGEGDNIIWDFSNTSFFHPFFLFPFAIYRSKCKTNIDCKNLPSYMRSYLSCVRFFDMLTIEDDEGLKEALKEYLVKSYIPICRFSRLNKNIDSMQTIIQSVVEKQKQLDARLKTPISYLISELVCNIDQHSDSEFGYIYTQYLSKENSLDICIADDGITIYGSYVKTQKLPEAENRGFGISSTKSMIVEGLGGAFFMLSGGAFHRHDINGSSYVRLPESISWDGTVILMRIPLTVNNSFDYMKYIR